LRLVSFELLFQTTATLSSKTPPAAAATARLYTLSFFCRQRRIFSSNVTETSHGRKTKNGSVRNSPQNLTDSCANGITDLYASVVAVDARSMHLVWTTNRFGNPGGTTAMAPLLIGATADGFVQLSVDFSRLHDTTPHADKANPNYLSSSSNNSKPQSSGSEERLLASSITRSSTLRLICRRDKVSTLLFLLAPLKQEQRCFQ
jgi:hypothetical protein